MTSGKFQGHDFLGCLSIRRLGGSDILEEFHQLGEQSQCEGTTIASEIRNPSAVYLCRWGANQN